MAERHGQPAHHLFVAGRTASGQHRVWEPRRGFGATSFATTLATDPTVYPDVMPIHGSLDAVLGGSAATAAAVPGPVDATGGEPLAAAVLSADRATSGSAWLVWLVCGLVAVALVMAGGWAMTRSYPPRPETVPPRRADAQGSADAHHRARRAGVGGPT